MNFISDITSDYRYTLVTSAMYGRTLLNNQSLSWDIQLGPGLRYNALHFNIAPYSRPVAVFVSHVDYKIEHWGHLSETFRYELGRPYNFGTNHNKPN